MGSDNVPDPCDATTPDKFLQLVSTSNKATHCSKCFRTIITSASACQDAAHMLGLSFQGETQKSTVPEGCYFSKLTSEVWFTTASIPGQGPDFSRVEYGQICARLTEPTTTTTTT